MKRILLNFLILLIAETASKGDNLKAVRCLMPSPRCNGTTSTCITKYDFDYNSQKTNEDTFRLPSPENCLVLFKYAETEDNGMEMRVHVKWTYSTKLSVLEGFRIKRITDGIVDESLVYKIQILETLSGRQIDFTLEDCMEQPSGIEEYFEIEALPNLPNHNGAKLSCKTAAESPNCCSGTSKLPTSICENFQCPKVESSLNDKDEHNDTRMNGGLMILLIASVVVTSFLLIVLQYLKHRRSVQIRKHKQVVVLVSSGDSSSRYKDKANSLASRLKSSCCYDDVYFNGWCMYQDDSDYIRLRECLEKSRMVVMFTSPYGKLSYAEFIERKEFSVWKDAFVIGSHILLQQTPTQSTKVKPILYVVYANDGNSQDAAAHIHADLLKASEKCFDVENSNDLKKLNFALQLGRL